MPLIQFLYIQEMLAKDQTPLVVTVSVDSIPGKMSYVMFGAIDLVILLINCILEFNFFFTLDMC